MRLINYRVLPVVTALLVFVPMVGAIATPDESPHWDKSACTTCHSNPAPTDASDLRVERHVELCADCHGDSAESACPHPTDLPTQDLGQLTLPASYAAALDEENIVCTSCHSMRLQCTGGRREQYRNPAFLRDGPFRHAAEACFECHGTENYTKLNPHQPAQTEATRTCLLCHNDDPRLAEGIDSGYRLHGNEQCTGCHKVTPHPLSIASSASPDEWTHLVVPTPEMRDRMQAARYRTLVELPLDANDGAINCTTCHNVHDPDSIDYPLHTEDGTENRLRMLDICEACHDQ